MKVSVSYDVSFDVDVPEDAIKAIKEQGLDFMSEGDALNTYFREHYDNIRKVLDLCDGAEIICVYNENNELENPTDVDEVIWEA